jgi:ubiquitin-conjugating enzyme E2 S
LEGPADTPYEGKFFLLRIAASHDFPSVPPAVHFLTKVYHPNVDPATGAVCVNTLKKDWRSTHTLSHVLSVIRCLLIVPFPESSLNEDAGRLLMESYDEYCKRARLHADVHGRVRSIATKETSSCDGSDNSPSAAEDSRVLQTSSRNTAISSTSGLNSPGKLAKKGGKVNKTAMTKKKSLKRL